MRCSASTTWSEYPGIGNPRLRVLRDVPATPLAGRRDILVYLPETYRDMWTGPILYFHDGQNLFDSTTSTAGATWETAEALDELARQGLPALAVGIPHGGLRRPYELNPFPQPEVGGGEGRRYLSFVIKTVIPLVESSFGVIASPQNRGIIGSSMGGLISLFAFFRCPGVFGLCGALSPALWFEDRQIIAELEEVSTPTGRIYLDVGTQELTSGQENSSGARNYRDAARRRSISADWRELSRLWTEDVRLLFESLISRGYRQGLSLLYREIKGGIHHESAWAERLPDGVRFLLGPLGDA